MNLEGLGITARALVAPGKGILAADESHPSIGRRFEPLGIPNTEETRRRYRQMLITTPGVAEYVSGVILFDETIRQAAVDGSPLVDVLARQGMIPGIKVDPARVTARGAPKSRSRKVSTACASASPSTRRWAPGSPSGEPVIASAPTRRRTGDSGQRPRARPLRGLVPGSRGRPDRRAGGSDRR